MEIKLIKQLKDETETGEWNGNKIDILLVDIIKKLNSKGYITKYCCQGHPTPVERLAKDICDSEELIKHKLKEDDKISMVSFPYITFAAESKKVKLLPLGWYKEHDKNDKTMTIRPFGYHDLTSKDMHYKLMFMNYYLNSLERWAEMIN